MKTLISIFTFLFFITFTNLLNAQYQLGEKWVARYNLYGGSDISHDIAIDGSGNIYVAGEATYIGAYKEYETVKYNSAGVQQWAQIYGWGINHNNFAVAIAVSSAGNVYVTGYGGESSTNNEIATVCYNSSGVQQWVAMYLGMTTGSDYATDIALDNSGNVYVVGRTDFQAGEGVDILTIKYNSSGVQQWAGIYHGAGHLDDGATCVAIDAIGNSYTGGYVGYSTASLNYALLKRDASGTLLWEREYNGSGNGTDAISSIALDGSGNPYVTGYSMGTGHFEYATLKYNSSGVQQWVQTYAYLLDNSAYDIAVDQSTNVYVTGWSKTSSTCGQILTVKYNTSGVFQWYDRYGSASGNLDALGYCLEVDNTGYVYVTGKDNQGGHGYDYVLLRYSTSGGAPLATKTYNGPGNNEDIANKCAVDANGCIYVTGGSLGSSTNQDFCTVKYVPLPSAPNLVYPPNNSTGISLTPLINWDDVLNAESYSLQVSTNSGFSSFVINVASLSSSQYQVPANSFQNNILYYWRANAVNTAGNGPWSTVWNFRTLLVGLQPIGNEIPADYKLYENFPNPFNPSTSITFDLPKSEYVKLSVYDLLGREVEIILSEKLNAGKFRVDWNGSNYPSGVYFYKLVSDDFTDVKKMVLVK